MNDSLAPLFADRATRLSSMPEAERTQFESVAKASDDPMFTDRQLSAVWISQRTGLPHAEVVKNFDALASRYFGEGATPAKAYDSISALYKAKTDDGAGSGEKTPQNAQDGVLAAGGTVIAKDVAGSLAAGASKTGYDSLGGLYSNLAAITGVTLTRPTDNNEYRQLAEEMKSYDTTEVSPVVAPVKAGPVATMGFPRQRTAAEYQTLFGSDPEALPKRTAEVKARMRQIEEEVQAANLAALAAAEGTFAKGYSDNARKIANTMYELSRESVPAFGVRAEFADSTVGQLVQTVGSLPVTALYAALGPVGAGATYTGIYGQVEQERMQAEGDAYNAQTSALANLASAGPQAVMEFAFGMERVMGKIMSEVPKVGGKLALGEAARLMARTGLASGLEEGVTEPLQNFWNDYIASLTYDEKRELFTPDALKKRLVESASAFALGALFGGAVQGLEIKDRNNAAAKSERFLLTREGKPFEAMDYAALRSAKTDAELKAMAPDPQMAEVLIAAANGDVKAQNAYRQETLRRAFVETDGLSADGVTIGKVGQDVVLRNDDGTLVVVDPADPKQTALLREVQSAAIAKRDFIQQSEGRLGQALSVTERAKFGTFAEMIQAGEITRENAQTAIDIQKSLGKIAQTATLDNTGPIASASAKEIEDGVYQRVVTIAKSANPLAAIEDISEAYIHQQYGEKKLKPEELRTELAAFFKSAEQEDAAVKNGLTGEALRKSDIEAFSKLVVDYALGNRKVELSGSWGQWLRTLGAQLREMLRGATQMRKLMRDGKLSPKLEGLIKESLGSQQQTEESAEMTEDERTAAVQPEMAGQEGGLMSTFSLSSVEGVVEKFTDSETGRVFETGKPVSFRYVRNTKKAPRMGATFGQDIEPAGRYLSPIGDNVKPGEGLETGTISFDSPLVLNWVGYGEDGWKARLSRAFGGKKGKALSRAVFSAGFDGIVTVSEVRGDKYASETVDLGWLKSPTFSLAQTETPDFARWFGNSKVVDAQGKPLVMYHGTSAGENFASFDPARFDPKALFGPGIYTTASADIAGGTEDGRGYASKGTGEASRVLPLYVSIKAPFNADEFPADWNAVAVKMDAVASELYPDDYLGLAFDTLERMDSTSNIDNGTLFIALSKSFDGSGKTRAQRVLREMGHDGIIHTGGLSAKWNPDVKTPHMVAIAFTPEQVKSSIGNRGTFDASSPDITFSLAQTETPEFSRWFGNSKVVDSDGKPLVVYHGTDSDFTAFDKSKVGSNFDLDSIGFFFTTDSDTANRSRKSYPKKSRYNFTEEDKAASKAGKVIPVFLRIENPLLPRDVKGWQSSMGTSAVNLYDLNREAIEAALKGGNYDGVIIKAEGKLALSVIDPTQIKSATDNAGTFDPTNPDITFRLEQTQSAQDEATYAITGIPQNRAQQIQQQMRQIAVRQAAVFPYPYHQLAPLTTQAKVSLKGVEASSFGKALLPVSERLRYIADTTGTRIAILSRVRRYYSEKGTLYTDYANRVKPLMRGLTTMTASDLQRWTVAASNQDAPMRDSLTAQYGLQSEWAAYEQARDQLRNEMLAAGIEVGDIGEYFPRWVKDVTGLRESMGINASDGALEDAVFEVEKSAGRPLTLDEVNTVLDGAARGVVFGAKGTSKPSNAKARKIVTIQPNQVKFYADANHALDRWLRQSTDAIARFRFFGKQVVKSQANLLSPTQIDTEASIGTILREEVAAGNLSPTAQNEVKAMLDGLFAYHGQTNAYIRGFMDLTYWGTMGKLSSALAQVVDLTVSVYEAGPWNTAMTIPQAMFRNLKALPGIGNSQFMSEAVDKWTKGKDYLTREQLGIDRVMEEFNDQRFTSRALNQVFIATGLNYIDGIGKDVLINAKFRQLTQQAKKGQLSAANQRMIEGIFGKQKAQSVIADFATGTKNSDTIFAVYNVLADWQPISLAEYPEVYAKSPNGRVLYMLKSYSIKALAAYRRESQMLMWFGDAKEGSAKLIRGDISGAYDTYTQNMSQKALGARNLAYLLAMLWMAGASKDWLVDFMLDRDPQMEDIMVDNIFKLMQVSRYTLWQQRNRNTDESVYGITGALAKSAKDIKQIGVDMIVPPFVLLERPGKDVAAWAKAKENGDPYDILTSESVQFIPVAGEFLYWTGPTGQAKIERRRALREKASE